MLVRGPPRVPLFYHYFTNIKIGINSSKNQKGEEIVKNAQRNNKKGTIQGAFFVKNGRGTRT